MILGGDAPSRGQRDVCIVEEDVEGGFGEEERRDEGGIGAKVREIEGEKVDLAN